MEGYQKKKKFEIVEIEKIMVELIAEMEKAKIDWEVMRNYAAGGYSKKATVKIRKSFHKIANLKIELGKEMLKFEESITKRR